MKKIVTIFIIALSVFSAYSKDYVEVKNNIFHIGLVRSSLYGRFAGNTSFDRLINNGIFSIGVGVDGAKDLTLKKYTIEPNLRVCLRPFKILNPEKLSYKKSLDPYVVFTPLSVIFTRDYETTDDYDIKFNSGLAIGLNFNINKVFGLWTEYGISEYVRGAGGVLLQF